MKKHLALLVLMALVMGLLSSCRSDPTTQPMPSPTPEVTLAPAPTPSPTPEPTAEPTPEPVPTVAVADYTYERITNGTLAVQFKYPSHWISNPGKTTICYTEPVNEGEVGARVAATASKTSKTPTSKQMKNKMASFIENLGEEYQNLEKGKINGKVSLRARMRLYIDMLRAKKLFCPLNGQGFHFIHALAAAVVALAGITLGIFVGQNRPHGGHDSR